MATTRIRELRVSKGLTIKTLAGELNIKESTLSKYERSEREPNIETLLLLSEYFNVSVDYLIGKTNCAHEEFQPVSDLLGMDEKTIEILKTLSSPHSLRNMDYLEAIIQHPQFSALLNHIHAYLANSERGWQSVVIYNQNGTIANTISAELMESSSMQLLLTTFQGIIAGIPYSPHFINKPPATE